MKKIVFSLGLSLWFYAGSDRLFAQEILGFQQVLEMISSGEQQEIPDETFRHYFDIGQSVCTDDMVSINSVDYFTDISDSHLNRIRAVLLLVTEKILHPEISANTLLKTFDPEGNLIDQLDYSGEKNGLYDTRKWETGWAHYEEMEWVRRTYITSGGYNPIYDQSGNLVYEYYRPDYAEILIEHFTIDETGAFIPVIIGFRRCISLLTDPSIVATMEIPAEVYYTYFGMTPMSNENESLALEVIIQAENFVGILTTQTYHIIDPDVNSPGGYEETTQTLTTYDWEGVNLDQFDFSAEESSDGGTYHRSVHTQYSEDWERIERTTQTEEGTIEYSYNEFGAVIGSYWTPVNLENYTEIFKLTESGLFELVETISGEEY